MQSEIFQSIVRSMESIQGEGVPRAGFDDFNRLVISADFPLGFHDYSWLLEASQWEQDGIVRYTMFAHAFDHDGSKHELKHYINLSRNMVIVTVMYWLSHKTDTRSGAEAVKSLARLLV